MPNRIIKESITYSADLDQLKPFEETVFYRLLVRCDDYGRLDARIPYLKSMLFVTKPGVTEKNVEDAVSRLACIGLIDLYQVEGKPYLCFPKWNLHQRVRDSKAKYPAPDHQAKRERAPHIAASCGETRLQSNPYPNPYPKEDEEEDEEDSLRACVRERVIRAYKAAFGKDAAPKLVSRITQVAVNRRLEDVAHRAVEQAALDGAGNVASYVCKLFEDWGSECIRTEAELEEYLFLRDCAFGKHLKEKPAEEAQAEMKTRREERRAKYGKAAEDEP